MPGLGEKERKNKFVTIEARREQRQSRSQPVSHLLLSGLSRGSVHLQLYPLSQFYKKVKLAREPEIGFFGLSIDSLICV